jgi:hypothetical protein
MIEILSALDFWQQVGIIAMAVLIPVGLIAEAIFREQDRLVGE